MTTWNSSFISDIWFDEWQTRVLKNDSICLMRSLEYGVPQFWR